MIIGLSGYARSGKDEAAKGLGAIHYTRVAFADKLREFLYRLNPLVKDDKGFFCVRLQYVIDRHGWDGYKETPWGSEIRELLQRVGSDCGRELIGDNVWVDAALNPLLATKSYVVTDVRFPNEALAIKSRGGIVLRITRPGVGPANGHYSEVALDEWVFDHVIENDRTIADLHRAVYRIGFAYMRK